MSVDYAYTALNNKDSVVLQLDGYDPLPISQCSTTFGINQIPEAMCTLSIGRNAFDNSAAEINSIDNLTTMIPASIYGTFSGQYAPGQNWPTGQVRLFRGYYVGGSYQKINGRVQYVIHLLHWLADLGFSSCLSAATNPSISSSLVAPAIFAASQQSPDSGATGQPSFIPELIGHQTLIADVLGGDLWAALKSYFCTMSKFKGFQPTSSQSATGNCSGGVTTLDVIGQNNRASRALAGIEGPAGNCAGTGVTNVPYLYGVAINSSQLEAEVQIAIATHVGNMTVNDMVHQTYWDAIVGYFCPDFGLDLCPAVDRAVMQPAIPGWRGGASGGNTSNGYWRTITPSDYDYIDETGMLPKPLRGVIITGKSVYDTRANIDESSSSNTVVPAGVYAIQSQDNGDGSILYQDQPAWLSGVDVAGLNAGDANGTANDTPVNTATTTNQGKTAAAKTPKQLFPTMNGMLDCYARLVFIQNTLRGRTGNISGRLRFDIAPGSHVVIQGSPEQFLGSQDTLGSVRYGQVVRVTCEIDAEGRRASTAMQIAALRNAAENASDRTSIEDHPFFPNSIGKGGLPLLPEMDLL